MDGPSVLRFKARLSAAGLDIPKAVGKQLSGMNRVEGVINGHPFRAPIDASGSGSYSLRVNAAMRKGARARDGETVSLAILGPEPDPKPPADLRAAFKEWGNAKALWDELTIELRRDWVRWIVSAKQPETRARRVRRTVEQLDEGKRRPCCVNQYEFMLGRVGGRRAKDG